MVLAAGDILEDRYRVVEEIGSGGFGVVVEAEDSTDGSRVAIKQLQLDRAGSWKSVELFQREARILSQLDHPRIPKYVDYFERENEECAFFLVQRLVPGRRLTDALESGFRPTEEDVEDAARQLLELLIYMHSLSPPVIHRDIKPDNVIRNDDGELFLVDFGCVQEAYRGARSIGSTVVGTLEFMAPEQLQGRATAATDLYSLGATLAFLLTRRTLGELPQLRGRVDMRQVDHVSPRFARWLNRLLGPNPADRFPDARSALDALDGRSGSLQRTALLAGATLTVLCGVGLSLWASASEPSVEGTRSSEPSPPAAEHHQERAAVMQRLSALAAAVSVASTREPERFGVVELGQPVASRTGLPPSAGPIPAKLDDVAGKSYVAAPRAWKATGWRDIGWSPGAPQRAQYRWTKLTDERGEARAQADFDGDGNLDLDLAIPVVCDEAQGARRCRQGMLLNNLSHPDAPD